MACFTKVYLITNIDLYKQYETIQTESPQTWQAFLKRIKTIKYYPSQTNIKEYNPTDYTNRFINLTNDDYNPFSEGGKHK